MKKPNIGDKVKNRYHAAEGEVVEIKNARGRDLVKIKINDPFTDEPFYQWYDSADMDITGA